MCENQLNLKKKFSQILFQDSPLRKQGQKLNFKKDNMCFIIATNQNIGSKNAETEKQQHQTKYIEKKGKALIGAMSAKYNLETFSDAWHMDSDMQLNICQIITSGSRHVKNSTVKNIKIGDGKYIQAIGSDIDILTFNRKD